MEEQEEGIQTRGGREGVLARAARKSPIGMEEGEAVEQVRCGQRRDVEVGP